MRDRLVDLAGFLERHGHVVVPFRVYGPRRERLSIECDRFRVASERLEGVADV